MESQTYVQILEKLIMDSENRALIALMKLAQTHPVSVMAALDFDPVIAAVKKCWAESNQNASDRIACIKLYRNATKVDLRTAKETVDEILSGRYGKNSGAGIKNI